jgi:hypothetical protein
MEVAWEDNGQQGQRLGNHTKELQRRGVEENNLGLATSHLICI